MKIFENVHFGNDIHTVNKTHLAKNAANNHRQLIEENLKVENDEIVQANTHAQSDRVNEKEKNGGVYI